MRNGAVASQQPGKMGWTRHLSARLIPMLACSSMIGETPDPARCIAKLVFRDMLTRLESPDPQHPTRKGAVLTAITAISYATLDPGATASGRAQTGERQVFYATGEDPDKSRSIPNSGKSKMVLDSRPHQTSISRSPAQGKNRWLSTSELSRFPLMPHPAKTSWS
jgi:hypothetical protein